MQTLHSVLKRGLLVWDRRELSESIFHERLELVQAAIAAAGHDAWIVYGDAQRYGDVAYLTHFLPRTRGALALVPRGGASTLLASVGPRDIPAAKVLTWVEDIRPFTRLPARLAELLRERGLERGRIGRVGLDESLGIDDWEELRRLLPDVRWEETDGALMRLRLLKAPEEITILRRCGAIVREGLDRAAKLLQPGVSERKLCAAVDRELRYMGAEDTRLLSASGERVGTGLAPPDDRALNPGDVLLLHVAVQYQRYWAEAGQTYVLGPAGGEARALARTAHEALTAMTAAARPGVTSGAVAAAARAALRRSDLKEAADAYGLGHGIGLDLEEPPYVRDDDATRLAEGMTLALHVVLHDRGGAGALTGQTVLIGRTGVEPLT